MRILLLNWRDTQNPLSGGAELVTLEHAKYWVSKGHSVVWLTGMFDGAKHLETLQGISIVRKWKGSLLHLYVPIYLLLHAVEYDVIIDEVHGIPFFSPLFTKVPVIVFIHEIAGDIWDYMFTFPKNIIGKFLEQWLFRLYKHCIFWTDADSTVDELVERGIDRSHCVSIPCPIIERSQIDKKVLLNQKKEKKPIYIFVSRVVRMKGIEEVIKAFSFIAKEQKDANLWIVGGGDKQYIAQLYAMIEEYGVQNSVTFWGKVSETQKYELLSKSHILLHASVKEGWGLVVLEAASVGVPSVVYNVPGLRDVVHHNKTGIVISDNSPREMAKEAMILFNNTSQYTTFKKNGIAWVASLRWDQVASQSLYLLQKTVQNKNIG